MSDLPLPPAVQVRFLRRFQSYREDDIATFPIDAARQIVGSGVAVAIAGVGPDPTSDAPTPQRAPGQRVEKG